MKPTAIAGFIALLALAPVIRAYRRGRAARSLCRWQRQRPPARWPSASIILPAWRERGMLEACLAQLKSVDYEDYEVIVVAGGPDGTLEIARAEARGDPRLQVIPQRTTGGKNGAMNDGARQAKKEVLVFLDADALVTRGWLKGLVAALGEDFAASTGKYVPAKRTLVSLAGEMSQVLENEARGRVILQGSGGMAVRRAAFEAIAGIPEGCYADDWALSTLLEQKGYKLAYAPDALLFSERPASLVEWWRNELRWRRMHLLTLFRVGSDEPRNPLSGVKALYPYVTAWGVFALSTAAIVAGVGRLRIRGVAQAAWAAFAAIALAREMAGAVETAAYTGQAKWLRTGLIIPVLTGLHWAASMIATLTTGKAALHFKGPRHDVAKAQHELLARSSSYAVVEAEAQAEVAQ